MTTNIGYWEKVLQNPTPAFRQLFDEEKNYLATYIPTDSFVLDVGCGDGTTIQTILPITKNVVGIDNDKKAVEDAREKLSLESTVKIIFADALSLPFADKTFDVVTHMMTLVNFEKNKTKALIEMSRVLKDNGKIIVSVYSDDALSARLEMYRQIGVPIKKTEGSRVIFDESVGANESEQFSKEEIQSLVESANLQITNCKKVNSIAFICELKKS